MTAGSMAAAAPPAPRTYTPEQLVHVPVPILLLSIAPLIVVAVISLRHELELASPIVVSSIRTFVQLSILGLILDPIFAWGIDYWPIVFLYVCFMVLLASREASNRTKYIFKGQFMCLLAALLLNVAAISAFAFGVIIKPTPVWNPQYVIPICGMLLGNCINGIALSMNAMLSALVEQQREIELYLSFGATGFEACSRLVRESIRAGTTPTLNAMAVIGLVSIPGMMTGQILGGAPVVEAARYQMLIMYLIATCAFGCVLMVLWVAVQVGFDSSHMLRTDRFRLRGKKATLFGCLLGTARALFCCCADDENDDALSLPKKGNALASGEIEGLNRLGGGDSGGVGYDALQKVLLEVRTLRPSRQSDRATIVVRGMKRSVPINERNNQDNAPRRVLFRDISLSVGAGEIASVRGPSGAGKSQLLRVIAGLSAADEGELALGGDRPRRADVDWTSWRRAVRYVTQFKVDVPGTPRDFAKRVASFKSHRNMPDTPDANEMLEAARKFIQDWSLDISCLDKDWTFLSGGEAQRVILALAFASRPKVLLLDEVTSALDMDSKTRVENSIKAFASENEAGVILVTHDQEQVDRIESHNSAA